jgi:hypothetical protein
MGSVTNGQGPSRPHWRLLAAICGCWWGFLHKTHKRVEALMSPNFYGHGIFFSIGGHWRSLAPLVPVWGKGVDARGLFQGNPNKNIDIINKKMLNMYNNHGFMPL